MKITKSQLKQIVQEELMAEFWNRKKDVTAKIEKEREKLSKKEKKLKSKTDPGKSKEIKLPSVKKTSARKSAEEKLAALKLKEARTEMGFEQLLEEFLKQQEEFEGTSVEEMAMGLKNAWARMSEKVAGESPPITHIMEPPPPKEKPARDWLALFEKNELKQMIKQTLQEVV